MATASFFKSSHRSTTHLLTRLPCWEWQNLQNPDCAVKKVSTLVNYWDSCRAQTHDLVGVRGLLGRE
ncbi:MAG: hypothetical protein D6728_14795 [Cyanobacteria bacterium J055]|nr:MAG: hypothetical protein D6728_14795 [Cyanobacteria bacterium J055]